MLAVLPKQEIVLWGMGHTHLHVLRQWRLAPIPNARLTCVSDATIATYSGMLPGVLANQYPRSRMELNLIRLCRAANAGLVQTEVRGIDLAARRLLTSEGPTLAFDLLSIGIGSVPSPPRSGASGEHVIAIKPMRTFLERLQARLVAIGHTRPIRVGIVGGGAGGVEIAFCLPPFVRSFMGDVALELTLIHGAEHLGVGSHAINALVRKRLAGRGVRLLLERRAERVEERGITLDTGEQVDADALIWATSAVAPAILNKLGLPCDERGFLLTRPTLQTLGDPRIFAVGDSGTIQQTPTAKAGVYAVRQGPVLWQNMARAMAGLPLHPYRPQRNFLRLINTGDGRAIGAYRGFTFEGRWCWRLKDWIDRRFMDQFQSPGKDRTWALF